MQDNLKRELFEELFNSWQLREKTRLFDDADLIYDQIRWKFPSGSPH